MPEPVVDLFTLNEVHEYGQFRRNHDAAGTAPVITIDAVTKNYGSFTAVDDVSEMRDPRAAVPGPF